MSHAYVKCHVSIKIRNRARGGVRISRKDQARNPETQTSGRCERLPLNRSSHSNVFEVQGFFLKKNEKGKEEEKRYHDKISTQFLNALKYCSGSLRVVVLEDWNVLLQHRSQLRHFKPVDGGVGCVKPRINK